MSDLVTLTTFENAVQAHLCRSFLDNEGVEAWVADENMGSLNPFYNQALGGIRLQVRTDDLPRAQELLQQYNQAPLKGEDDAPLHCPHCGSTSVQTGYKSAGKPSSWLSMLLALLFYGTWPVKYEQQYYCRNCKTPFGGGT